MDNTKNEIIFEHVNKIEWNIFMIRYLSIFDALIFLLLPIWQFNHVVVYEMRYDTQFRNQTKSTETIYDSLRSQTCGRGLNV